MCDRQTRCQTQPEERTDIKQDKHHLKALGSVNQMAENGNRLVFDQDSSGKDTSYIQNNQTNDKIWLRQEHSVYVLDLMVALPLRSNDRSSDPLFHWQG